MTIQPISILLACAFIAAALPTRAHEGEDHSGAGLTTVTTASPTALLYVPVETQLLARIETVQARLETVSRTLRVLGRTLIHSEREATVTTPQEGRLIATGDYTIPALGEFVKRDQVIAVVEESIAAPDLVTISTERARATSELRQAETLLMLAQRDYDRLSKLTGVATEKDIAAARNALEVAKAKRDGFSEQVSLLDNASTKGVLAQKRRVIRAPLSGMISRTHVTVGENVTRDKALFQIVDTSELLVEASVFENDVAAILAAKRAFFTVEAFPGESFPARILSRGAAIDERTRALPVLFAVANGKGRLFGGMFGRVYIETGSELSGITVPKSAVVDLEGQPLIYLKTGGEQFSARLVKILERLSDRLVLADEGMVKPGDRVVVQGTYQVRMAKSLPTKVLGSSAP